MKFRSFILSIACLIANTACAQIDRRFSSYRDMSIQNKLMQDNLSINPAMFWVLDGQQLWDLKADDSGMSCQGCHGNVVVSMKGVAATFPKVVNGRLRAIEDQINFCRTNRLDLAPLSYESQPMLALSTLIAKESRGFAINLDSKGELVQMAERGRLLYFERIGQLNLSCANCHDERAGSILGGIKIPQGHPTAYPIYRIEWQGMGSLQRRIRGCMTAIRAERYPFGSDELKSLETYLRLRAQGMTTESPGVRP